MTWLFSLELVEDSLGGTSLAGEPSAQLNVMRTAHSFWRRGSAMEFSQPSPSGQTLRLLTADAGEELLKSYLAGFPVPISAPREKEPESMESRRASGDTWPASWVKYDQPTSSWRTAQCSLAGDSEEFSGTWPRSGLMRAGTCLELPSLATRTAESASGFLLPTPSGVNAGKNNTMGRIDEWGGSSNPLRGTVIGSMCSPEFEEMVMGWPIGWTELTPFETGKFQQWLQQHGAVSAAPESLAA
jgi:hypothetical protein